MEYNDEVKDGCDFFKVDLEDKHDTSSAKTVRIEDVDRPQYSASFTYKDVILIIISIISYFFDIATDIMVAYFHYTDGNSWYCGLTLAFILVPSLTMTGFSFRWYLLDSEIPAAPPVSQRQWALRIIFLLFQLGPVLRYLDVLYYGLKSKKQRHQRNNMQFIYMTYEDADAVLLRLFESFMEAAPQLVLQLYIMAKGFQTDVYDDGTVAIQCISIFASLLSLSWGLASYHRALRLSCPDKAKMTWKGTVFQILWYFFLIASRVLVLGLFASHSKIAMAAVCGAHWSIMTAWIISMKTDFCDTRCEEVTYNAVLGVVFIFCYFNPKDTPTRRRYLFYYILTFIENTVLICVWYHFVDSTAWFRLPAIIAQFLSFALALVFMVIYYFLFHPTGDIHWYQAGRRINCHSDGSQEKQISGITSVHFGKNSFVVKSKHISDIN